MFRINITREVLERLSYEVDKAYECIGLLLGFLNHDGLWVVDIVPSRDSDSEASCIITARTLARVADDIARGRISTSIVGWYHSHPGYGVFMSKVDIRTHEVLLQFSPYVVSMVIDPRAGEFGIWACCNGHSIVQVPTSHINIL